MHKICSENSIFSYVTTENWELGFLNLKITCRNRVHDRRVSGGLDNVNSGGVGRLRATVGDLDNVTVKAVILAIVGSGRASLDNVTVKAVVVFRGVGGLHNVIN